MKKVKKMAFGGTTGKFNREKALSGYEKYLNSMPSYQEARKLSSSLGGKQPSQEQIAQLNRLSAQIQKDPKRRELEAPLQKYDMDRQMRPQNLVGGRLFGGLRKSNAMAEQEKKSLLQAENMKKELLKRNPNAYDQTPALKSIPMPLAQQQDQYDKNMRQAQSLPPAERARFAEQFQRAATAGDKSTIRPGTVFGDGSGISQVKPKGFGNAIRNTTGLAGNIGKLGGSILGGTQNRPANPQPTRITRPTGISGMARNPSAVSQLGGLGGIAAGSMMGKKPGMKKGGSVKKMASGGSVSSASKRADGCAIKGKTKGKMV